jgi:hypothetical protein
MAKKKPKPICQYCYKPIEDGTTIEWVQLQVLVAYHSKCYRELVRERKKEFREKENMAKTLKQKFDVRMVLGLESKKMTDEEIQLHIQNQVENARLEGDVAVEVQFIKVSKYQDKLYSIHGP